MCLFWEHVRQLILQFTPVELGCKPVSYLLHISGVPLACYKSSLTIHLLNAAKAYIPALWKQAITPPNSLWLANVKNISNTWIALWPLNNMEQKICNTQFPWSIFSCISGAVTSLCCGTSTSSGQPLGSS